MAATFYYRTVGRMAAVLVTTGAGSTNVITGVMDAWMDSIPLLVLSGNEAEKYHQSKGRGFGFQGYDSVHVAKGFTKLASRMCVGDRYTGYLDWHLAAALRHRQGPVWIDIPRDVQNAQV